MKNISRHISKMILNEKPNTLGDHDETKYWLCEKDFISTRRCSKCEKTGDPVKVCRENRIVKDHCHLTGKIRGLTHNICNLNK